mmetsp:Transcript_9884/g.15832  ORF Transcript_9884/g.15832 Transcript_9884/m.15832 type:complete len:258 (-) Transcript_9884:256-1029(-)
MPSYSVRRQRIKEFKDVCSGTSDSIAQQVLEDNSWNVQQAINHFFNNRHLYPELKQGSKGKLEKIWKEYADKEDPSIMSEQGMLQFFKDMGVNPESHETLVVSYMINAEEMGIISRDEFVNGFYAQGCSSLDELKKCVQDKCKAINRDNKQWRSFYKWVFQYVKEDEKKKTIDSSIAIQLWNILFQKDKHSMKLADQWMKYADAQKDKELKVVSKDLWEQIYDFLKETKSVDDYDDAGGSWPVAVDEFVEWLQEQKK